MNMRTSAPAAARTLVECRPERAQPTASSTTRTATPSRARAARASMIARPVASLPTMNIVRSMDCFASRTRARRRMYAFSPVAISSNELPSRGCATPLAARSRVMPDSCVNASEPARERDGRARLRASRELAAAEREIKWDGRKRCKDDCEQPRDRTLRGPARTEKPDDNHDRSEGRDDRQCVCEEIRRHGVMIIRRPSPSATKP